MQIVLAIVFFVPSAGLAVGNSAPVESHKRLSKRAELQSGHYLASNGTRGGASKRVSIPGLPDARNVIASDSRLHRDGGHVVLSRHRNDKGSDNDLIDKIVGKAGDAIENVVEEVEKGHDKLKEKIKEVLGHDKDDEVHIGEHREHKGLMSRINILRSEMCLARENLAEHQACMAFLGIHCIGETTGQGVCHKFAEKIAKLCQHIGNSDAEAKKEVCTLAEDLKASFESEETQTSSAPAPAPAVPLAPASGDRDGDGHKDEVDAFPDDPMEWHDLDEDGIGDQSDPDIDGDGRSNAEDRFPLDKEEWEDIDEDGVGNNKDPDRDGDGVANEEDVFPDNPSEWQDTDGDGHGDNEDDYPLNRHCWTDSEPCPEVEEDPPVPPPEFHPGNLDKAAQKKLPEQGYNEFKPEKMIPSGMRVRHKNYYTWTGDWQNEWPLGPDTTDADMDLICRDYPDNDYCKQFLSDGKGLDR